MTHLFLNIKIKVEIFFKYIVMPSPTLGSEVWWNGQRKVLKKLTSGAEKEKKKPMYVSFHFRLTSPMPQQRQTTLELLKRTSSV